MSVSIKEFKKIVMINQTINLEAISLRRVFLRAYKRTQ